MAKAGKGVRTRQYNPGGAINLAQYVQAAVDHVRGSHDAAGKIIHETPKAQRRAFAREIWFRRGYRGKNPAKRSLSKKIDALLPGPVRGDESDFFADLEERLLGKQPSMYKHHHVRKPSFIAKKNPESPAERGYRGFHGRGPDRSYILDIPEVDPYSNHPELFQIGSLIRFIVGEGIKLKGKDGDTIEAVEDGFWHNTIEFVPSVDRYHAMVETLDPDDPSDIVAVKKWLHEQKCPDVAGVPLDNGDKSKRAQLLSKQLYIVGGNQVLDDKRLLALGADPSKDIADLGNVFLIEYFTQKRFDRFQPINYWHHFSEESGFKDLPRLIYYRKHALLQLAGGAYTVKRAGIAN